MTRRGCPDGVPVGPAGHGGACGAGGGGLGGGGGGRGGGGGGGPDRGAGGGGGGDGGGPGSRCVPDRRAARWARRGRQDGRDVHAPLLAHGTAVDVDAGQPQHQGVHRLDRAGGRRGGG